MFISSNVSHIEFSLKSLRGPILASHPFRQPSSVALYHLPSWLQCVNLSQTIWMQLRCVYIQWLSIMKDTILSRVWLHAQCPSAVSCHHKCIVSYELSQTATFQWSSTVWSKASEARSACNSQATSRTNWMNLFQSLLLIFNSSLRLTLRVAVKPNTLPIWGISANAGNSVRHILGRSDMVMLSVRYIFSMLSASVNAISGFSSVAPLLRAHLGDRCW